MRVLGVKMSSKKVAVLDIGSDAITLVMQDNKYANHFIFKAQQNYDGYQDGEFLDKQGLFKAIEVLVKQCKATTFENLTDILVGVPGEWTSVVCRNVEYDMGVSRKVTNRDIEALFQKGNTYDGGNEYTCINASPIHFITDDNTCTINPLGMTTNKLVGFMSYILCENTFKNIFDKIATSLGVKFEYTSAALAEVMYVVSPAKRDEGVILVDVGYISSTVSYAKGDGILCSVSFSRGGGNIAGDITTVMDIPFENSLELINKINLNLNPAKDDEYNITVGSNNYSYSVEDINEIAEASLAYTAEFISAAIASFNCDIFPYTEVLLTGSGISTMPGVKECLSKILERDVEIIAPDLLQFNKPKHSSLAGLLTVQHVQMAKGRVTSLFTKLKDLFRRKK